MARPVQRVRVLVSLGGSCSGSGGRSVARSVWRLHVPVCPAGPCPHRPAGSVALPHRPRAV